MKLPKNAGAIGVGVVVMGGLGLMAKRFVDMKRAQALVAPPAPAPAPAVVSPPAPPAVPATKV